MYMLAAMWFVPIVPRTTLPQDCWHVFPRRRLSKDNTYCFKVQGESNPSGQDSRLERQGRHETLTPLGGTYGEVGCMMKDMLIGVCVLLCFINSRVRKIRNDAFSCPVILSRTRCLTVRASWFHSSSAGCSCVAISASGVILRNRKIHRQLGSASQSSMQRGEVGILNCFFLFSSLSCCYPTPKPQPSETRAGTRHSNACSRAEREAPARRAHSNDRDSRSERNPIVKGKRRFVPRIWKSVTFLWHFVTFLWNFVIFQNHHVTLLNFVTILGFCHTLRIFCSFFSKTWNVT